jgi:hypothetical protein
VGTTSGVVEVVVVVVEVSPEEHAKRKAKINEIILSPKKQRRIIPLHAALYWNGT